MYYDEKIKRVQTKTGNNGSIIKSLLLRNGKQDCLLYKGILYYEQSFLYFNAFDLSRYRQVMDITQKQLITLLMEQLLKFV